MSGDFWGDPVVARARAALAIALHKHPARRDTEEFYLVLEGTGRLHAGDHEPLKTRNGAIPLTETTRLRIPMNELRIKK